jgi:hypothetical protein
METRYRQPFGNSVSRLIWHVGMVVMLSFVVIAMVAVAMICSIFPSRRRANVAAVGVQATPLEPASVLSPSHRSA